MWGILRKPWSRPAKIGSPPRVWGILYGRSYYCLCVSVHPHACGEYAVPPDKKLMVLGSPPRVWGIRGRRGDSGRIGRFTPTRVGNTAAASPMSVRLSVHPHACGEYFACPMRIPTATVHPHACGEYSIGRGSGHKTNGSPPRVWGIRGRCPGRIAQNLGSPPRVWGIRRERGRARRTCRFTPTRVGNTGRFLPRDFPFTVHPHACGEYVIRAPT